LYRLRVGHEGLEPESGQTEKGKVGQEREKSHLARLKEMGASWEGRLVEKKRS